MSTILLYNKVKKSEVKEGQAEEGQVKEGHEKEGHDVVHNPSVQQICKPAPARKKV